jgi:hypothetical protein
MQHRVSPEKGPLGRAELQEARSSGGCAERCSVHR